jgi:hypothetical protein
MRVLIIDITISLLFFVIGPRVLSISNAQPYSLRDIAALWTLSLGVSLGLYLVCCISIAGGCASRGKTRRPDTHHRRRCDRRSEKIHKRQWPLQNRRAVKSKTGVTPRFGGFTLWPDAVQDSVWVIPANRY